MYALRQSSERQVRQNTESQLLRYAVAERMYLLWAGSRSEIINSDPGIERWHCFRPARRVRACPQLGSAGRGRHRRLAGRYRGYPGRTKTGCRLLEVCQIFGTANRRRATGIRFELSRRPTGAGHPKELSASSSSRSYANDCWRGREVKGGHRGELFKRLPDWICPCNTLRVKLWCTPIAGFTKLITTFVFTKFRGLWSVRQTFKDMVSHDHDVQKLPANPIQGTGLVWKIPSCRV